MASFFGRLNYTFKDRYLLTATLRADGSSNFASGERWGFFPSVAAGWRFTEEEFLAPLRNVLSNGKLRLSYGETGNSNVGDKAYSYYKVGNNNIFGNSMINGVYLSQLGNNVLTWETAREWNVGLDLGFLDGRVNVTAEYYHKVVSDLLNEQTLLSYNEVNKIIANVGKTQSQGFELTINTTNIRNKDFEWTSDLTFSLYRDKWKERDPKWKPNAYDEYNGWMRYYSGYLSDGLVQVGETIDHMPGALPGQVKIKDIDGYVYESDGSIKVDKHGIPMKTGKPDGKLDDADKVIYGSADPGYLFGFNNTLRWKNFDFNVYFYGQFDKLSAGSYKKQWLSNNVNDLRRGYNQPTSISDLWSSSNPNGTLPGYFQTESAYGVGDYYYEKTWFIRCRNITLGYNIPIKTSKHILSNVRVYFDVNNPFTITPYTGLDPETDISSSESAPSQLQWAYPNVRTYSFGLDITF
jgi:TonB-linked SusC/RagA family outer membrane protein